MSETGMTFTLFGKDVSASKALEKVGLKAEGTGKHFTHMGKMADLALKGTLIGALVGAGVALEKFATDSVDKFGEVGKEVLGLQRVVGGSAEDVSRLASEFKMTGIDAAVGGKAIGLLSKHLAANDKVAKGLGVAYRDSTGHIKSMQDILPQLAEKFSKMHAGPERTALALQIFGKNGTAMLPFLAKGSAGLKDLAAESDKLGTTLSGKDLDAVKANTIAKRKWGEAMTGVQLTIGKVLFPIMTKIADWMTSTLIPVLGSVAHWFSENLAPAIQKVGDWIMQTMVPAIGALVKGFMENVWPAIQKVAGMVAENLMPAIQALADYWTSSLLPAIQRAAPLFQKVAIVLGVVVGAIVVVIAWVIGHLIPVFAKIVGAVVTVVSKVAEWWSKMIDNVTGLPSRIASAASGMWDGIKNSFRAAINWLIDAWNNFHLTIGGGTILGVTLPSVTLDTPNIPHLANGGIVTRPTLALIGEAGPEAVVPLSRGRGFGGTVIHIHVAGDTDPAGAARRIGALLDQGIASGSWRPNRLVTR